MRRASPLPLLFVPLVACGVAPPECVLGPVPAGWREARLAVADARIALPPVPLRRIGPMDGRLEGWYGERFQVLATVSRDTLRQRDSDCSLVVAGQAAPLQRVVRRPRPPSTDSVYGARVQVRLADGRVLSLELGAEGRSRFDSLRAVFSSLTLGERR